MSRGEARHKGGELSARIMKLMSMFSGLQALSILASVVKMKIVALWLGTVGVGLFGIYQSVLDTIFAFTNMGISQSGVREVAAAKTPGKLAGVVRMVRRWSMYSGMAGALLAVIFAVPLGYWFFDSAAGCWGFVLLGISLFLNSLCNGEQALLQGTDKLRELARANMWGIICGLGVSIPLFYWCGNTGVVLSIVVYSLAIYIALRCSRVHVNAPSEGKETDKSELPKFVKLGLYIAAATFLTSLGHTVFIGILNNMASTSEVGLVQAGDTLVMRYVGLLFTAIGMEFYPRVAANNLHNKRLQVFVNHEITLLMLCLTPLLCLFLLLRGAVVDILYSAEFTAIIPFVSWAVLSSIPKAMSCCMGMIILAKGDGKVFLLTEGLDTLISVPLCLASYNSFGLSGLGVAYIIWYIAYAGITWYVYSRHYGLRLNANTLRLCFVSLCICLLFSVGMDMLPGWVMWCVLIPVVYPFVKGLVKLVRR